MSGGAFEYQSNIISQFAEDLQYRLIQEKDDNEWFQPAEQMFSPETIKLLHDCQQIIKLAGDIAHDIEWLFSGDHGEESFIRLITKIANSPEAENHLPRLILACQNATKNKKKSG